MTADTDGTDNVGAGASGRSLFEVVQVGATVTGLAGPEPVKIIAVERLADDSANVMYRGESGPAE